MHFNRTRNNRNELQKQLKAREIGLDGDATEEVVLILEFSSGVQTSQQHRRHNTPW